MAEPETSQPRGAEATASGARRLGPIVALCAIIWLVVFWCQRHLGVDLVAVGAGAGLSALPILNYLFQARGIKESAKDLRERAIRRTLAPLIGFFLDPAHLVVLAIVVLAAGSTVSSVVVVTDQPRAGVRVLGESARETVPSSDEPAPELPKVKPGEERRFYRLTSPFGRAHVVVADGLMPRTVTLYPWLGARVNLADSDPLPTLLMRLPASIPASEQGHILELRTATGEHLACATLTTEHGAVLFGPAPTVLEPNIPEEFLTEWRRDLTIGGLDSARVERRLRLWLGLVRIALASPIETGARLEARLISPSRELVASREFTVSGRAVQDVGLVPLEAPFEKVTESPCFEGNP